nr:salicylate 1-monooxygenase SalA [Colletotrichum truncatum]KAF6785281.1 salicylate 1-monooxygenase SalA [Colletotrichum truncatum]
MFELKANAIGYLNFAAFVRDGSDWIDGEPLTTVGSKRELLEALAKFAPNVQALVETLPEEMSVWALFDTLDHPLHTFADGGIVLVGDAAHASTPHFGVGAGIGVEDALALATVLECAVTAIKTKQVRAHAALTAAFKAFDSVRRERSQWVVTNSRYQGKASKWLAPDAGPNLETFMRDTQSRYDKIILYDWKNMLRQVNCEFEQRLSGDS